MRTIHCLFCVFFRLEQALGTKKTNQEKSRDEFGRSATVSKESALVAVCLNKMSLRLLTEDLDIAEFIVKSKIPISLKLIHVACHKNIISELYIV